MNKKRLKLSGLLKTRTVRLAGLLSLLVLLSGSLSGLYGWLDANTVPATTSQQPAGLHGWGAEALLTLGEQVQTLSPVPLANACGLGASSCFRCHNGRRAELPPADPWHQDHSQVNYSCVGCHQGNPRVLKQDISHRGLSADPRTTPEASCSSCHNSNEVPQLLSRYQSGSHP